MTIKNLKPANPEWYHRADSGNVPETPLQAPLPKTTPDLSHVRLAGASLHSSEHPHPDHESHHFRPSDTPRFTIKEEYMKYAKTPTPGKPGGGRSF